MPARPTAKEIEAHNLTHCPPRAWCDHCVRGQFKDRPHRTSRGEDAESSVPRVNIDYFFLKDDVTVKDSEHEATATARTTMTCLCMQESLCHSVWGYAVRQKGSGEAWIAGQLADDITAVGLAEERTIVKSDQEPAITCMLSDVVRARAERGRGGSSAESKPPL